MEKSSVECTVDDDSVQTSRKNPTASTNITLPVISVGKKKGDVIICHKESKGLLAFKSRHASLLIVADMSLVVNKEHVLYYRM